MSRASFLASITGQPRLVCVQQIARDVARAYGVPVAQIMGARRQRPIVAARHEVMRRAYAAGLSLTDIGASMRRDHTSVLNGIRRASEKMRENAKISVDLRRNR